MGSLTLNGATSGQITINPPAVAGTTAISLPAITGGSFIVSDSSGNVGIGTSSPNTKFVVSNGGAAGLEINPTGFSSAPSIVSYNRSGAAYTQLTLDGASNVFAISGTEKARIDSSGNLLVGTTTQATGALLTVNGSIKGTITSGTSQASTSGTSIDFTGIPSWAKRVTVMFQGVSTNGSSPFLIRVGAGSVATSGYAGGTFGADGSAVRTAVTQTTGFGGYSSAAISTYNGSLQITLLTGNTWSASGVFYDNGNAYGVCMAGAITLGGALDRVRVTTVNGTDTFDGGNINILYEG